MSGTNRVLLIGLDPRTVSGVDAELVETAIAMGDVRLREHGFDPDYCLVAPDDAGEEQIAAAVKGKAYDCVIVGGGIRKPEPLLGLFERVVNLLRVQMPLTPIAFNTTGENSVEAVLRWLGPSAVPPVEE